MQGYKYAGVTLDWYDDRGETLKGKFPTPDLLPDIIKTADIRPKERLANEDFALVMVDQGHVYRKYACADPGTTAMSTLYFMEHGDKLPEEAMQKTASNLLEACLSFGILPPPAMTKVARMSEGAMKGVRSFLFGDEEKREKQQNEALDFARGQRAKGVKGYELVDDSDKTASADQLSGGLADEKTDSDFSNKQMRMGRKVEMEHTDDPAKAREISRDHLKEIPDYYTRLDEMEEEAKQANVVDVTGLSPRPRVKVAAPQSNDDYAVVMSDGNRYYPIHTWDLVKEAEGYFQQEKRRMHPEVRRQFATKLAHKSFVMGYPLEQDIATLGARGYGDDGYLEACVEMRKVACAPDSAARADYDELFEKRAELHPEVYAECLRQLDTREGLDSGWDQLVLDPWASTFGIKTASVLWENESGDRVTEDELINLAENHLETVTEQFTDDMANEFRKDPKGIFNSMPAPQKKLLARMAADSASYGGSEHRAA